MFQQFKNDSAFLPKSELATKQFAVGDWVYSHLYGGRYGVITEIHGDQSQGTVRSLLGGAMVTGGSASFSIVFENGTFSPRVPECIVRGVQWSLPNREPASAQDISDMIAAANAAKDAADKERRDAEQRFQDEVERLKTAPEYKSFVQVSKDERASAVAAKNIRKVLKQHYPNCKFSVRNDRGTCIWVQWPGEAELNQSEVSQLLSDFKTGHYDPYEDYHSSTDSPFNVVYGGIDYLTCQRRY